MPHIGGDDVQVLTVFCSFKFMLRGVGTVSSRRVGAYAEDIPGCWF